jgi:cholesterol oxidase
MNYDAIVIGTGFGATVAATRLAEMGKKLLILERGTWWISPEELNHNSGKTAPPISEWITENGHPVQYFPRPDHKKGILDFYATIRRRRNKGGLYNFSKFKQAYVLTASGVGGGSLIYSNVNSKPDSSVLNSIGLDLGPADYRAARAWMETYRGKFNQIVTKIPLPGRDVSDLGPDDYLYLDRSRALKNAAAEVSRRLGIDATWKPLDLSIIDYDPERGDGSEASSEHTFCDRQGRCILGCLPSATHSLNKTVYARVLANPRLGATLCPLANVRYIQAIENGYEVFFEDYRDGGRWKSVTAPIVFLGGGTLGTTEILLRSRERGGLRLGDKLGSRFSTNGNFAGFAVGTSAPVHSTRGPINTCGIQLKYGGYNMSVEDCGIPAMFASAAASLLRLADNMSLRETFARKLKSPRALSALPSLMELFPRFPNTYQPGSYETEAEMLSNVFLFSVAAEDDASGVFRLYKNGLDLDWPKPISKHPVFESIEVLLKVFSEAMGGRYVPYPLWQGFADRKLMIVHPLGGCPVGPTNSDGVVDEFGRVFDGGKPAGSTDVLPGLYVIDGSVIPGALATNPVLTIAAQAIKSVAAALP